ncbi:MAG: hypothetical protein TR69_WS6001000756 [candidate division WS6 bacterium OLB20]|uniref:Uncharacterized protein n=1 Tax=candidate division WS6 bacterium OLB20 TaxID=1617426 RepID=A0A136LYL8_9BACT|nr:MAG: hypothetical protein TR69_WS6001000756 [candidate division WS6 bacterium OLB20]
MEASHNWSTDGTPVESDNTGLLSAGLLRREMRLSPRVQEVVLENGVHAVEFSGPRIHNEMAAYLVSDEFGFELIPPTELVGEEEDQVARRLFVRSNLDTPGFDYMNKQTREQILKVDLFDYITARRDRQGYGRFSENHMVINGTVLPSDFEMAFDRPEPDTFNRRHSLGQVLPLPVLANINRFAKDPERIARFREKLEASGISARSAQAAIDRAIKVGQVCSPSNRFQGLSIQDIAAGRLQKHIFTLGMLNELKDFAESQIDTYFRLH